MDWYSIWSNLVVSKLASTFFLIIAVLVLRRIVVRNLLRNESLPPTLRRRWIVTVKNAAIFFVLAIVVIVWLEQLRTVAASLIVIAAAIVIATKEFILNLVGFVFRTSAGFIAIGDRIQVDDTRGDVIDQNLMGVTVLEIGPGTKSHQYTGLTIFLPNAAFLASTVKNETRFWGDYVFHVLTVPLKTDQDWKLAEAALLQAADEICAPYLDQARDAMKELALKFSLDNPSVDPRIHVQISDTDEVNLVLRVPVPSRRRGRLEQEISRRYLLNLEALKAAGGTAQHDRHQHTNG